MNKEDIIRMAREAASEDGTTRPDKNIVLYAAKTSKFLERFAALVAAEEREACAELVWPTQQVKVWSDKELTDMTVAFNRTQEKHGYGWYETIMAVGATALKDRAAVIRARGNKE
jgi:hypothetical protein